MSDKNKLASGAQQTLDKQSDKTTHFSFRRSIYTGSGH